MRLRCIILTLCRFHNHQMVSSCGVYNIGVPKCCFVNTTAIDCEGIVLKEMRMDRKTRYTRKALKDSLMELMADKPVAKITIKELCENADINRSTFYAHYTDPYDLLRSIEAEAIAWAEEAIHGLMDKTIRQQRFNPDEAIEVIAGILQYFADNDSAMQVLMSEQGDIDFQKQLFTLIYEHCNISVAGSDNKTNNRELDFVFVINGSVGLIRHWLKDKQKTSARALAETIVRTAAYLFT